MSDLISRSELLTRIRLNYNNHQNISASAIKDMIDTMLTAYDIDKVVRQLNLESVGSSIQMSLGLLRAIEIVKQGGVSDDVCEKR